MRGRDAKYGLYIPQVSHADLNMGSFEETRGFVNGLAFQEDTSNEFYSFYAGDIFAEIGPIPAL